VDDYDVVKATIDFQKQQPPLSRFDRQLQELEEAVRLRTEQAASLFAMSRKKTLDPELRSHYARVRSELLAEVRALEEKLTVLLEAQQQSSQASSCWRAEACPGYQELTFGSCGAEVPSVVVQ
jgi:hypothetical protein